MQGFAPADDRLLFRQKEEKPFLPVRYPSDLTQKQALRGAWSTAPNQDGSETRGAQTVFAKEVGFVAAAQPRPRQEPKSKQSIWRIIKLLSQDCSVTENSPSVAFESFYSSGITAFGCGGAGAPNRLLGESCLSEASSLAIVFGAEVEGPWKPCGFARGWKGRRWAEMVLVTFAETKVTRLQGAKPCFHIFTNT
ncbi:MAG: hypothetical protein O2999_14610 [Nitrospirae bacterium]|nr:hypothetical protein [Nitrospirota bacterium]